MLKIRTTCATIFALLLLFVSGCGTGATTLPAPVFSPTAGSYSGAQSVAITDSIPNVAIRYTTDGTTPNAGSKLYGGPILVVGVQTIRAYASLSPANDSPISSAVFNVTPLPGPAPLITPATGTYSSAQIVLISGSVAGSKYYYTTDGSTPTTLSTLYSRSLIFGVPTTIKAIAVSAAYAPSPAATSVLTFLAAAPIISPNGGTYTTGQNVTLTDSTPGAVIYYTLNGSVPTASSLRYTAPFRVNATTTIRAIAIAPTYADSSISQATITLSGTSNTISGNVLLAKQGVAGAQVTMYVTGKTGVGSAATNITGFSAPTTSAGQYSLNYTCPNASDQAYLVSRGGTPTGRTAAVSALVLVSPLGSCSTLGSSAVINEVTTVASAYSLAQFTDMSAADAAARIGTTSTNARGLANALLTAGALTNVSTGAVSGPNLSSTTTLPTSEINTLATIAASCGAVTGANPCTTLLNASNFAGAFAPTDSFMAMVNVALHPNNNLGGLYSLASGTAYTPKLASSPSDWTLGLTHTGGGINQPTGVGADSAGNIWIANNPGSISKLSPQGAAISPATTGYTGGGLSNLKGLAIDPSGNVWVTSLDSAVGSNSGHGAVQKFSSTGTVLSGATGFGGTGVYFPSDVAVDAFGNAWIANSGNSSIAVISPTGTLVTPAGGLTGSQFVDPLSVAIDATNGAWFSNQGGSSIVRVAANRTPGTPITCCSAPAGIALDGAGNIWATNPSLNTVSEVRSTGTVGASGNVGSGNQPQGITVDGAGKVWVANFTGNSIAELQGEGANTAAGTLLSGTAGFGAAAALNKPTRLTIDASGNLWITSNGNNSVVEFVGVASPVKMPLTGLPAKP